MASEVPPPRRRSELRLSVPSRDVGAPRVLLVDPSQVHSLAAIPPPSSFATTATCIQERLHLGNAANARDGAGLQAAGVTHIVNACQEEDIPVRDNIVYKRLRLKDSGSEDLLPHLNEALPFIHTALCSGGTVFVHCAEGISRSPSIIIGYLMIVQGLNYSDAFDMVHRLRPIVAPNWGFSLTLEECTMMWKTMVRPRTFTTTPLKDLLPQPATS